MQVLESKQYSNFVNSINSEQTRRQYEYTLTQFLKHYQIDLDTFLGLSQKEISDYIINYLANRKISKQYKIVLFSAIKHACEMNDVILNWKKLKKFIKSEKTENSINGKDRGYNHQEIRKILEYSDQRLNTAFLVLTSTGIRIGALQSIRIGDLERFAGLYKITIYRGDTEEYITFCTPECAKEIQEYLDFRTRRGEKITKNSYLIVRKFSLNTKVKGKPFKSVALRTMLQNCINNTGLRDIDHQNPRKRKEVAMFHGFRKFFTKQLVDSNLNPEIREMLLGHKIGLASAYYKPTEQEMLKEYSKAIDLLTISEENKLKRQVENLQVEKSRIEALELSIKKLEEKYQNN